MEKKKSQVVIILGEPPASSPFTSRQNTSLLILVISCTVAAMLQLQLFRYIFKDLQPIFHGFVLSNGFAFSCSFSALFLPNKPRLARFCVLFSVASMASAVTLLLYATYTTKSLDLADRK